MQSGQSATSGLPLRRDLPPIAERSGNQRRRRGSIAAVTAKADETAKRLAELPEVSQALTLNSLIPTDQDKKIAALKAASQRLGPALNPPRTRPAPDDQENIAAIQAAAEALSR